MVSNSSSREAAEALKALLIEATRLHFHVAAASRALAGPDDLSNAQVSVLRSLGEHGPRTVPQLAAERAIARQPVQRMVDELADAGLVRSEPNPQHRRSRLIALTPAGRRGLDAMERRQSRRLAPAAGNLSESRLRAATNTLRRVRQEITRSASETGDPR